MKKTLIIIVPILLILVAGGVWFMGEIFSRPLYAPGTLSKSPLLPAPSQIGVAPSYWRTEKGILLYHFEDGSGTPVLIIHGGPGVPQNQAWAGLKLLNNNYKFVYYHQRGCGKSTRPFDTFSSKNYYENMKLLEGKLGIDAQLADIEHIRQLLGVEKLIIVGHSFGGFLASLYAAEYPDHVAKLILVSPAEVLKMPQKDGGLYEEVRRLLPEGTEKKEYELYLKRFFDYGKIFSQSEQSLSRMNFEFGEYYAAALKTRGKVLSEPFLQRDAGGWVTPALFFSLGRKCDFCPFLRNIKAPTLIVLGKDDLMPAESAKDYSDNIPGSRVVVIEGASHFAFAEKPERFAKVVTEFLQ